MIIQRTINALDVGIALRDPITDTVPAFNPFPDPGISHGRPLARRDRPDGVAGPGGVARRRSMVSRLRPGE